MSQEIEEILEAAEKATPGIEWGVRLREARKLVKEVRRLREELKTLGMNHATLKDLYAEAISWKIIATDGLPPDMTPVLAEGFPDGRKKVIRAAYARKGQLEANRDDCDDFGEYDEERDEWYAPEGWYEWNECEEIHWRVSFPVTSWILLPEFPGKPLMSRNVDTSGAALASTEAPR